MLRLLARRLARGTLLHFHELGLADAAAGAAASGRAPPPPGRAKMPRPEAPFDEAIALRELLEAHPSLRLELLPRTGKAHGREQAALFRVIGV